MAQLIEDIIATDKHAREIVQKAQTRREQIMQDANADRARLIKEGEDKLSSLRSRLASDNENFEQSLKSNTAAELEEKKAKLLCAFNASKDTWTSDIFTRLTAIE